MTPDSMDQLVAEAWRLRLEAARTQALADQLELQAQRLERDLSEARA